MRGTQRNAMGGVIAAELAAGNSRGARQPMQSASEERIRREYEQSPEYILGCQLIDSLTRELGVDADTVAAMLDSSVRPEADDVLSYAAAGKLMRLEGEGKLARPVAEYLDAPQFQALLREMPAEAAVRLFDAQNETREANTRVSHEREVGVQETLERLRARRALPAQVKPAATASAEPDFENMTTEQFNAYKRRYFGHR